MTSTMIDPKGTSCDFSHETSICLICILYIFFYLCVCWATMTFRLDHFYNIKKEELMRNSFSMTIVSYLSFFSISACTYIKTDDVYIALHI